MSIMSKSFFATLLSMLLLLVGGCGGGGGGGGSSDSLNLNISANSTVDLKSSYTLRKTTLYVDSNAITTQSGFKLALAYTDINHDGLIDVFLSAGDSTNRTAVQVLINNGSNIFTDQTSTVISNSEPGVVHPRKMLTGDYNGDGWPDFFVIGHGYDQPPFPGEYPLLFLSNGNGTIRYVSGFESLVGYHHGGASADIDNDGDIDIFVADTNEPFFLINGGHGDFSKDTTRLPTEIRNQQFYTTELNDIDKDGFVDLIVGGHEYSGMTTTIYWGSTSGTYKSTNKTVLPSVNGWGVVLDFAFEDINSDGLKDIIINRTGSTNFYTGRYIQIIRQTSSRQFTDETISRITIDTTMRWFPWLRVQDIDGDGHVDIFIDDKGYCSDQCAWRNDGNGSFTPYTGAITPSL